MIEESKQAAGRSSCTFQCQRTEVLGVQENDSGVVKMKTSRKAINKRKIAIMLNAEVSLIKKWISDTPKNLSPGRKIYGYQW